MNYGWKRGWVKKPHFDEKSLGWNNVTALESVSDMS